jgi:hypothetical protein
MNASITEAVVAINCVDTLFYNYTDEDLAELRNRSRDFAHVWDTYVTKAAIKSHNNRTDLLLWTLWHGKFGSAKAHIADYALEKYGDQQRRSVSLQAQVQAAFDKQRQVG